MIPIFKFSFFTANRFIDIVMALQKVNPKYLVHKFSSILCSMPGFADGKVVFIAKYILAKSKWCY